MTKPERFLDIAEIDVTVPDTGEFVGRFSTFIFIRHCHTLRRVGAKATYFELQKICFKMGCGRKQKFYG